MGGWLSFDRDSGSVEDVKDYCKSVIYVKFYGQTSSMKVRLSFMRAIRYDRYRKSFWNMGPTPEGVGITALIDTAT